MSNCTRSRAGSTRARGIGSGGRRAVAAATAFGVLALFTAACSPTPVPGPQGTGAWTWTETRIDSPLRGQGLATDPTAPAPGDTWYSSRYAIEHAANDGTSLGTTLTPPLDVSTTQHYDHTGDLDAYDGKVLVPWQDESSGVSDPPSKGFGVYDAQSL